MERCKAMSPVLSGLSREINVTTWMSQANIHRFAEGGGRESHVLRRPESVSVKRTESRPRDARLPVALVFPREDALRRCGILVACWRPTEREAGRYVVRNRTVGRDLPRARMPRSSTGFVEAHEAAKLDGFVAYLAPVARRWAWLRTEGPGASGLRGVVFTDTK